MPLTPETPTSGASRREMLAGAAGLVAASAVSAPVLAAGSKPAGRKSTPSTRANAMSFITTKDGTEIYYKD